MTNRVTSTSSAFLSTDRAISICMPTYRRPERLAQTLSDIAQQTLLPNEIIIVDNDANGSARATVEAFALTYEARFKVHYAIQAEKNIALTRNMTLALASGPWLAFIDDDERAANDWLSKLIDCAYACKAHGVLAPVIPTVPDSAPSWIRKGNMYECPRFPTGTLVPLNTMRIGNALLHKSALQDEVPAFDPAYGVTGGSDSDLLIRLARKGVRIVWCDDALVEEPVEQRRLNLGWILRRAMRGGQDYARHFLKGRLTGTKPSFLRQMMFFSRALAQMLIAALLTVITLPAGTHHAARWLAKTWANFGKLAVLSGWLYREYA